jgi:hypothetical protein
MLDNKKAWRRSSRNRVLSLYSEWVRQNRGDEEDAPCSVVLICEGCVPEKNLLGGHDLSSNAV